MCVCLKIENDINADISVEPENEIAVAVTETSAFSYNSEKSVEFWLWSLCEEVCNQVCFGGGNS